jgi:hypothetical protein
MSGRVTVIARLLLLVGLLGLAACAAGGGPEESTRPPASGPNNGADLGPTTTYSSDAYQFAVDYPQNFDFIEKSAAERTQLTPAPAAWFAIYRPGAATSNAVEPADLEIRVFAAAGAGSLEAWLSANNLMPGDGSPLPGFTTENVSGVELCAGLGPGCSYYVLQGDWLYQMVPASLEGETMIHTFRVMS